MTLQQEFEAAGIEYARRLEDRRDADRLAAIAHQTQAKRNAEAFAAAVDDALSHDAAQNEETDQ